MSISKVEFPILTKTNSTKLQSVTGAPVIKNRQVFIGDVKVEVVKNKNGWTSPTLETSKAAFAEFRTAVRTLKPGTVVDVVGYFNPATRTLDFRKWDAAGALSGILVSESPKKASFQHADGFTG